MDAGERSLWTKAQRRALAVIVLGLAAVLGIRLAMNSAYLPDPPPHAGPRAAEIVDRIDPNTADEAMLAAIPRLGEKRAAAIVEYRDSFGKSHPGKIAFANLDDLLMIKGIGRATLESMAPFLMFPPRQGVWAATQSGR